MVRRANEPARDELRQPVSSYNENVAICWAFRWTGKRPNAYSAALSSYGGLSLVCVAAIPWLVGNAGVQAKAEDLVFTSREKIRYVLDVYKRKISLKQEILSWTK